jgi:hypothetical protein
MPVSLRALKDRTITVDVYKEIKRPGFAPGELIVVARLVADTSLDEELALAASFEDKDPDVAAEKYAGLVLANVKSWDLTDDAGLPIPFDADMIRQEVPPDILRDVLDAIVEHRRPGEVARRQSLRR